METVSKRHIRVERIQATRTPHGRHYYITIYPAVDADTANRLQYLLGDDPKRVDYNQARIESGLLEWNKLFESIGRRLSILYRQTQPQNRRQIDTPHVFISERLRSGHTCQR
ncbi:MAG: hypothetical protein ACHQ03_07890 [Candidatus Bathyarchaeia archaeon]